MRYEKRSSWRVSNRGGGAPRLKRKQRKTEFGSGAARKSVASNCANASEQIRRSRTSVSIDQASSPNALRYASRVAGSKQTKYDELQRLVLGQMRNDRRQVNFRRLLAWKAVDPSRDRGECDVPKSPPAGDRQARAIAVFFDCLRHHHPAKSGRPYGSRTVRKDDSLRSAGPPRSDIPLVPDIRREARGRRLDGSRRRPRLRRAKRHLRR